MKTKVFAAISDSGLEQKINRFLEHLQKGNAFEVVDIKFAYGFGGLAAMVLYTESSGV